MISRRITFSALFILILVASLFAGLTSCSDVFLQKESTDFALSFVAPGASSGRAADGAAHWNVTAWLELEDGTTLQNQQTAAKAGEPVAIAFAPVAAGTRLKVKVELLSAQPPLQKYAGESEFMEVLPGEKTIRLELKLVDDESEEDAPPPESEEGEKEEPVIVNADTPAIATQPVGETRTFAAGQATEVKKELTVKASVSDGGTLTYQWYSNTSNSTTDGTRIEGATSSSYEATVNAKETKYFYCIVTNTNNNVSGNKTAAVTSKVAILASIEGSLEGIEGSLTSINVAYKGEDLLVGVTPTDFIVIENYSDGNSVEISSIDGSYTVEVPENSIGNVPVTIKSTKDDSIQTQVTVPIKYELDVSNLTITGDTTVEQNGNLKLTAEYKADGNDVQYKLYDESGSSNTYKVIDNVTISWAGATPKDNAWKATAETNNTGSKTATVVLSTIDNEWCVTTNSIEKSHEYTVNAATSGGSGPANQAELVQAIANAPVGGKITINNTIVITDTLVIDKYIIIEGSGDISLLRDNTGTITGPMIEVKKGGTLKLSSITLDGQWDKSYYDGKNNPLIYVNTGTLELTGVTLKNNHMAYSEAYTDKNGQSVHLYAAAAIYALDSRLTIRDSTFTDFSANHGQGGVINIEGTSQVNSARITISNSTVEACGGLSKRALQMGSSDDAFGKYFYYDINNKSSGLPRQIASITPNP